MKLQILLLIEVHMTSTSRDIKLIIYCQFIYN